MAKLIFDPVPKCRIQGVPHFGRDATAISGGILVSVLPCRAASASCEGRSRCLESRSAQHVSLPSTTRNSRLRLTSALLQQIYPVVILHLLLAHHSPSHLHRPTPLSAGGTNELPGKHHSDATSSISFDTDTPTESSEHSSACI